MTRTTNAIVDAASCQSVWGSSRTATLGCPRQSRRGESGQPSVAVLQNSQFSVDDAKKN